MIDADLIQWLEYFFKNDADKYDAVALSRKNYYFGEWSSNQRSWPSRHIRLFRKSAGSFEPTIHTTVKLDSNRVYNHLETDGGAIIHHGYESLSQWMSKANRYTSSTEWKTEPFLNGDGLFSKIDDYLNKAKMGYKTKGGDSYEAVTHTLFFLYKVLDELKHWESTRPHNVTETYNSQRKKITREIEEYLKK
jgi:hypothetical protein